MYGGRDAPIVDLFVLTSLIHLDNINNQIFWRIDVMVIKRLSVVLILAVLMLPLSANGKTNLSRTGIDSARPFIAINQDGVILVVWCETEKEDGESGTIFYNVKRQDSNWEGKKNAGLDKIAAWTPVLDVDVEGKFHLTYADGGSSLNREIFHAIYDPASGWTQPVMIWNSPDNSAWQKIDVDGDKAYIVWFHKNIGPYIGSDIIMQSKLLTDQLWPDMYERISWSAKETSIHPAFKARDDKVYVCWMQGSPTHSPWKLRYKEAQSGTDWHQVAPSDIEGLAYYPELDLDQDDNVHIVFSNRTGNFFYKQRTGGTWQPAEILSNMNAPLQMGDIKTRWEIVVAVWSQRDDLGMHLYYSQKPLGGEWATPVRVADGIIAGHPRVWIGDMGHAHFVWEDLGGVNGRRDVYYKKSEVPVYEPIFAPLNFVGEQKENKAMFYREYIHVLSWAANPENYDIEKYMLYEIVGGDQILVQEFSSSTFEYTRRNVDKDKGYTYWLYAVDINNRIGIPAKVDINGGSSSSRNETEHHKAKEVESTRISRQ